MLYIFLLYIYMHSRCPVGGPPAPFFLPYVNGHANKQTTGDGKEREEEKKAVRDETENCAEPQLYNINCPAYRRGNGQAVLLLLLLGIGSQRDLCLRLEPQALLG